MSVKYEQSKDIMPFGHLVNGITCESETDRDENDSDVMNLRNHYTTQGHSDKKSTRIEHEEMQIVKPAQSFEQDIVIVATQKQSDKTKEMHGREESQCMTADQIDEQNNGLKPKQKQDKMMVDQYQYIIDKTDNTMGQHKKDIQSLKGTKERTNNEASRYISNNKKQTDSFENKKEVKCRKRICEKRKDNTAYPFSKERKQSKQNKDIQSLKAPREKTKHETPLHISNDKKPNESDELKQEMKCGKRIYEKRTKSTAYQFLTDKKQSGSVGQNKEIRCQKRTVTAHPISKPKKQKRSKGQDKENKCLVRLCERNTNKTVPPVPIDNQKTESVKNSTVENRNIQKSSKQNAITFDKIYWIIHTCLCYCMVLVVVDSYGSTQSGTWILNSTHVVFGERVVLRCTFETNICNKGSTRRWTKGKYQTFLINNGNSVNERKYREVISSDCFTSYLIITDFNQDDMGVQYTFAYSTMEFSNELKLERTGYISYPKNETTTGKISCEKRNLTLSLKLFDINPVPHCSMVIKNETISAQRNTKNTSEFLSDSEYIFQYKVLQTYKPEKLYVWCNFETRNITVFDEWFNCDDPKTIDKKDELTVYVAVPSICMIIVIISVIFIYKLKKKKKKKIDKRKEKDKDKEKAVQYTALTNGGVGT